MSFRRLIVALVPIALLLLGAGPATADSPNDELFSQVDDGADKTKIVGISKARLASIHRWALAVGGISLVG